MQISAKVTESDTQPFEKPRSSPKVTPSIRAAGRDGRRLAVS